MRFRNSSNSTFPSSTNFFYKGILSLLVKILVIDDNIENTTKISNFFSAKGISTIISNNPMQGQILIREEKFDVILLNVSLHITGGIGVIDLLASDDVLKNQNIFIFSGEDIPDIQVKNFLRRDGVNGFLKKPIVLDELLTVITK